MSSSLSCSSSFSPSTSSLFFYFLFLSFFLMSDYDGDSVTTNNLRDSANGTFVTLDDSSHFTFFVHMFWAHEKHSLLGHFVARGQTDFFFWRRGRRQKAAHTDQCLVQPCCEPLQVTFIRRHHEVAVVQQSDFYACMFAQA